MHPILTRLDRAATYLGAWLVVGVLLSGSLAREGTAWFDALVFVVPPFVVYAFVCLSAWYVCRALPLEPSRVPAVATASGAAALTAGAIWLALSQVWTGTLRATPGLQGAAEAGGTHLPFLFSVAVILYLLVLSLHYVALAYEATRAAERQKLELQVLTRDAELRALRAQINPHFLYNSLNSISALTTLDPQGARRMCVLLGDFLRNTLKVSTLDRIALADELALVDAFIGIEQVRFGARLSVERLVDETALTCRVPPLLLQPLVENAVGHGIAGLVEGGAVRFTVARHEDRVLVRIENPRDPDVAPRRRRGVGLENVRRRVQTAFGDRGRIEATADGDRFRVELNLPCVEE
jgi:two-component system, LytTR family, sensor histidine kinase AlgZ